MLRLRCLRRGRLRRYNLHLINKFPSYFILLYHEFKLLLKKHRHCRKPADGHNNLTKRHRVRLGFTAHGRIEPTKVEFYDPSPAEEIHYMIDENRWEIPGGYVEGVPTIGCSVSVIFRPSLYEERAI